MPRTPAASSDALRTVVHVSNRRQRGEALGAFIAQVEVATAAAQHMARKAQGSELAVCMQSALPLRPW
eukprot:5573282-Pleurochrysis_carterae.AAC.16